MSLDDERSVRDQIQQVGAGAIGTLAATAISTFFTQLIDNHVPPSLAESFTDRFATEAVKYYFLMAEEIADSDDDDEDEDDN